MEIRLKRAYAPEGKEDGFRVYVDRLWPRGLSKENFHYDLWEKQIAPSTPLRKWLHEDPDSRWLEFEKRYKAELEANPEFAAFKSKMQAYPVVTLLYSSRDEEHNNADVVAEELE